MMTHKTTAIRHRLTLVTALAAACAAATGTALAHDPHGQRLGKVHFKVECNAQAQREFDLAMAYYHSFAWVQIGEPLQRVLQADPSCGMAHWLKALASLDNPFAWPAPLTPKVLNEGGALLEAARTAGLRSERERDYVEALAVFFRDSERVGHRERAKALEEALGRLSQRHPEDTEAKVLHALVLSATFDPADKQYTNQLRAAQILEPIFAAQPDHPGVAHYLIHSYDYPAIAHKGLEAARRYGRIAADAPHALHMPSHIFTRVGAWRESIEANQASAKADPARAFNTLHAYDYMVYAHLQLGQDGAARKVREEAFTLPKPVDHFAAAYAYAAIPARLALERQAWADAAALALAPADYAWQKYPHAEAVNAFARGVGAARAKNLAQVRAEHERLGRLRDAAREMKLGYWAEQIDIQAAIVQALGRIAQGATQDGIEMLRAAAGREDATEKHVVTPGPILPARELLATALLEAGRPADALREFETVLAKEPNRLRAVAGAAQSAQRSGQPAQARQWHQKVLELTAQADVTLAEARLARRALGQR